MSSIVNNIFESLPDDLRSEAIEELVQNGNIRIERIVSRGHSTEQSQWYDQAQDEWVMVLKGEAIIVLEDNTEHHMVPGSYLTLPAHTRHRVNWTKPETETIWLAVHY